MTVIVTGAAGSIGRAVCEQLVRKGVQDIVLIDIAETPLFWLERDLQRAPGVKVRAFICNVSIRDHVAKVFQEVQPTAVIHCAALKHVGMCERNVCQAILTNLWGSWVIAELSALAKARCVIVSTDKAVNPTSVMGMTKHLAERIAAGFADTRIVRLVNVINSAGSVIPLFAQQIEAGGPVTVTNPEATRFFMEAGEAAALVVQQAMAPAGRDPIVWCAGGDNARKIGDLANEMIETMGKSNTPIKIIGLRPGEKLNEERVTVDEEARFHEEEPWFEPGRPSWLIGGACQQLMGLVQSGADDAAARQLMEQIIAEGY